MNEHLVGGVVLAIVGLVVLAAGLLKARDPVALGGLGAVGLGVLLAVFGDRIDEEIQWGDKKIRLRAKGERRSRLEAVRVTRGPSSTVVPMVLPAGLLDEPETLDVARCGRCFIDRTGAPANHRCPNCGHDHRITERIEFARAELSDLSTLHVQPFEPS